MSKSKMIDAIICAAKSAAILENKPCDTGDLFFTLAFLDEPALQAICKKLRIL